MGSERTVLGSERPDLGSKGLHLKSGRLGEGRTDGNRRKLPYVESKVIGPSGAAAQKEPISFDV